MRPMTLGILIHNAVRCAECHIDYFMARQREPRMQIQRWGAYPFLQHRLELTGATVKNIAPIVLDVT